MTLEPARMALGQEYFVDATVKIFHQRRHLALELVHDVRSKELQGADLPRWMEADPQAYDPYEFLKGFLDVVPE